MIKLSSLGQEPTFTVPIMTAADDNHKFLFHWFSAMQRIHMKSQALFSSKDKSKKLKCRLLQFLFGALKVNYPAAPSYLQQSHYIPLPIDD